MVLDGDASRERDGRGGLARGAGGAPPTPEAICPPGPFDASPLPAGAVSITPLCEGLTFTEGAAWFASEGALFFSDFQMNNAGTNFIGDIVKYTPGGTCETFISGAGTNGLAISANGQLLGARHLDQTVTEFQLDTLEESIVTGSYMNSKFSSPAFCCSAL